MKLADEHLSSEISFSPPPHKEGSVPYKILQNFEKQVKHEFKRSIDKMSVFSSLSY